VLISGDMLLPRISTNIGVWPSEPESSPVRQFLDALEAYKVLPQDVLVLPSHGRLFRGAHERVRQLTAHHHERLAETLAACADPQSAADIIPVMFKRELDAHQTVFALGETLAHLHYLRDEGKLAAKVGTDGVVRFARTRAATRMAAIARRRATRWPGVRAAMLQSAARITCADRHAARRRGPSVMRGRACSCQRRGAPAACRACAYAVFPRSTASSTWA